MMEFFPYILKTSVCIASYYLLYRMTLRGDTFFTLNRFLLLCMVAFSLAIPFLHNPIPIKKEHKVSVFPSNNPLTIPERNDVAIEIQSTPSKYTPSSFDNPTVKTEIATGQTTTFSYQQLFTFIYLGGIIVSLMLFILQLSKILFWLTKAKIYKKEGYKLAVVKQNLQPKSFGRFIFLSANDFEENQTAIIEHERTHIKHKHTYDLILLELVKIIHWFNPFVYLLIRELKEIQEYQVDREIMNAGIDPKAYQLLMIKKCVGAERYTLANSFNHCQIKNRIVMMNNQKTKKGKSWKVAIFLPVAVLMLMAFGNKKDEIPINEAEMELKASNFSQKEWEESKKEFVLVPRGSVEIPNGNTSLTVSIDNFWISNEITNKEYRQFYNHVLNNPDDSLTWIDYSGINNRVQMTKPLVVSKSYSEIIDDLMDENAWKSIDKNYFSNPKYDDFPVIGVNYKAANYYCIWRNQHEKNQSNWKNDSLQPTYRLPTENEWKYAASLLEQIDGNKKDAEEPHSDLIGNNIGFRIATSVFPKETASKSKNLKKGWPENDFESISVDVLINRREKDFFNNLTKYNILMNRYSKIMMNGKVVEINVVKQQVQQLLDQSLSKIDIQNLDETKSALNFFLVIQKDIATDAAEYNNVLNIVGNSFSVARDKISNKKFSTGFESLNNENRKTIETIIPVNVFLLESKQMSKQSETGPPPPPSTLKIKKDGLYLGKLVTLEELKKIIEFNNTDDRKMRFILEVEEGVTQSKVEEVKQVLKNAEIVRIEYSSKVNKTEPTQRTSSNTSSVIIEIKEDGVYCMNDLVSIERLKEIIAKNIKSNPSQIISLNVAPDAKMGQFTTVKDVLREAKALNVNYSASSK